jgi:hypothetical protein
MGGNLGHKYSDREFVRKEGLEKETEKYQLTV